MLTLLAPDIVEAIMDGRQQAELGVHVLREGFPVEWGEQRGCESFSKFVSLIVCLSIARVV